MYSEWRFDELEKMMKELTYNILRKMIESPLEVKYKKDYVGIGGHLLIKGRFVLGISHMRHARVLVDYTYNLPDKDLRRILSCVEHCEAIKVRNL